MPAADLSFPDPPDAKLLDPHDEIASGFRGGRHAVDVIVNLRAPRQLIAATDFKDRGSLGLLQQEVRRRQDAVLNVLNPAEFVLRHRYENIAGFSGAISQKALDRLLLDPRVESIQPVRILRPHLAQGLPLMNALASRFDFSGAGLSIAIVDTGVDYTHPRLGGGGFPNSKVIGGHNFGDLNGDPMDCEGHGTAVAGLAAGEVDAAGDYIGGVAPGARIYAVKISGGCGGSATDTAMVAAWDWCVTNKNADPDFPIMVISTSFGGGRHFDSCDAYNPAMTAAAHNAVAAGITVLASSGNDGYCESMAWPACISSVISVGAVYDADFGPASWCIKLESCAPKSQDPECYTGWIAADQPAPDAVTVYSNTAGFLDVLAPSHNAHTTDIKGSGGYSPGDYYEFFGGTSAACPYAAGAVAALQQASYQLSGSYLSPAQVRSSLVSSGDLLADPKVAVTRPRVNLGNAIASLSPCPAGQFLYIHNDGEELLEVSSVSTPPWIRLNPLPPYTVPGGDVLEFCVSMEYPACNDSHVTGVLTINSNDPDQPAVQVEVEADCPPSVPASAGFDGTNFCNGASGTIDLWISGGWGDVVRWFTGSCGGTEVGMGNPLTIPSPQSITTYFARWENPCGASPCTSITVRIPADLDGNGLVNLNDLAIFTSCATGPSVPYDPNNLPPGCTLTPDDQNIIAADFDADGDVDLDDFAIFQRCYTGQ